MMKGDFIEGYANAVIQNIEKLTIGEQLNML